MSARVSDEFDPTDSDAMRRAMERDARHAKLSNFSGSGRRIKPIRIVNPDGPLNRHDRRALAKAERRKGGAR